MIVDWFRGEVNLKARRPPFCEDNRRGQAAILDPPSSPGFV